MADLDHYQSLIAQLDTAAHNYFTRNGITFPRGTNFGEFISEMVPEAERLRAENECLKTAIRTHRDQKGDNRCWLDDSELYAILGESEPDTALPPLCEFLKSCQNYWHQRQFQPTVLDPTAMTMRQLQDRVAELEAELMEEREINLADQ